MRGRGRRALAPRTPRCASPEIVCVRPDAARCRTESSLRSRARAPLHQRRQAYRIAIRAPTMRASIREEASVAEPRARVAIIMGSPSDWEVMKAAEQMLDELGIASDARVISAHRTPARLTRFLTTAEQDG